MSAKPVVVQGVDLSKTFQVQGRAIPALANVSFEVRQGELVTIVGPSGCGKSTLLRLILGIEKPDSGTMILSSLSREIGAILQSDGLFPWRTAFQNACLGLEVRDRLDATAAQFVQGLIDEFGLHGFNDAMPAQLSGGMRQRVSIMRALASRPKLLLCDEPFSAVDFVTRLQLSTRFRANCLVRGITTIVVTHNIEEALFLGQRVLVMSGRPGRIVETRYPPLSAQGREDAVRCREIPEFGALFRQVWSDLQRYHVPDD